MAKVSYMRDFRTAATPEEEETRRRRLVRVTKTPTNRLQTEADALERLCRSKLFSGFASNSLNMTAWIELPQVYPMDVINALKERFERPGNDWKVELSYQDYPPVFDHLGFTPPVDWIDRLLKA